MLTLFLPIFFLHVLYMSLDQSDARIVVEIKLPTNRKHSFILLFKIEIIKNDLRNSRSKMTTDRHVPIGIHIQTSQAFQNYIH